MAQDKLTVADVLNAGQKVGTVGKGAALHIVAEVPGLGRILTACTGKTAEFKADAPADAAVCANCAKKFHPTTEGNGMTTESKAPESADAKAAEAAEIVEGFPTNGETTERIKRDKAAQAAAAKVVKNGEEQEAPEGQEAPKGKDVAVKPKRAAKVHTDVLADTHLKGLIALATNAARDYREGSAKAASATKEAALRTLDLREVMIHEGKPDLMGQSPESKLATKMILEGAGYVLKDATKEQKEEAARFKSALRNVVMDERILRIRALDSNPEALALYPGCSNSAEVFDAYGITARETQTEKKARQLRERKERAELAAKATPALEAGTEESSADEAAETVKTVAPSLKPLAYLRKITPQLSALGEYVKDLGEGDAVEFLTELDALEDFIRASRAALGMEEDDTEEDAE